MSKRQKLTLTVDGEVLQQLREQLARVPGPPVSLSGLVDQYMAGLAQLIGRIADVAEQEQDHAKRLLLWRGVFGEVLMQGTAALEQGFARAAEVAKEG